MAFIALDLTMQKPLPNSLYIWSVVSYFIYQTLDAIDGKQARRTGNSSPLGQLFDHGCDSLQATISLVISLYTWKCPPTEPTFFLAIVAIHVVFYCANWEEYHTGVYRTS